MRVGRTRRRETGSGVETPEEVEHHPDGPATSEPQPSKEWSKPQPGGCSPGICGTEPACRNLPNSTHICVCPQDDSHPTADLKCPTRITVPLTPMPIHNVIPPNGGNNTSAVNISTTTETINTSNTIDKNIDLVTIAAPACVAVLVLLTLLVCCWKWKSINGFMCKEKNSRKAEAPRTGEPLLAERYIANPQYSSVYNVPSNTKGPAVPLLNKDSLSFIEEIGEGCFGKVYKGMLKIEGAASSMVAIKVLKDSASRTAEEDFVREVNIMSAFRHENILTLIGIVGDNGINPSMVFEFMPYGDLAGVLRSNAKTMRQIIPGLPTLDSKYLLSIALQVARGMSYLASQRFVHRDLACRNCLVGEDLIVKIADFGMSRDVYTCDYYKMGGNRPMPIRWMSPESILYARFTLESDVWSYGVVLWEIYSLGKQPFYGHNNDGASKLILQGIMLIAPDDCPAFVFDLMRACWRTDPKNRIKFKDICDKLQSVYDSGGWEESDEMDDESRNNDNDSWIMSYDTRNKWSTESIAQLPLPPLEITTPTNLMDPEGYLVPTVPVFRDYLTTLPD